MMTDARVTSEAGYAGIARSLALRALAVAADNAPHRARVGEQRWPLANALPAARVLLDTSDESDRNSLEPLAHSLMHTLADPAGKVTDGFGHSRPVYACLALHIMGWAARRVGDPAARTNLQQATRLMLGRAAGASACDPRLALWHRLLAAESGIDHASAEFAPSDSPSPLVTLGLNDLIDAWTYHELTGLHAMHLFAHLTGDSFLRSRTDSAALYHLGHTQPDYTTYQPWALAAFASNPQTAVFAEQQLHDVATHLSIEGPGGAVVPALLLADAAATLACKVAQDGQSIEIQ